MKKLIVVLLTFVLFTTCVYAKVQGGIDDAINTANSHIVYYNNYNLYIVTDNNNYVFNNGVLSSNSNYINGGLVNKDEYLMTVDKNNETYLNDGLSYWTMTESGGFNYYISDSTTPLLASSSTESGARPTEYIQEDTEIIGKGTFNDPWSFVSKNSVNAITIVDSETGVKKMSDTTYNVNYGENKTINVDLPVGRKIDTSTTTVVTCTNGLKYTSTVTSTGIRLDLQKVKKGSTCTLKTTDIKYNVRVVSDNTSQGTINPSTVQEVIHGEGKGFNIIAADGYKYSSNTCGGVMSANNTYLTILNVTADKTCTVKFERSFITVTFNANGGSCSVASMDIKPGNTYESLPTPTRTGYIFNGWYTAASGGTKVTNSTATSLTAVNHTLYAQWTIASYNYTVNHYLMNTSGSNVLSSTQSFSATYNTTLTLANLRYTTAAYNTAGGIAYSYGTANGTQKTTHVITGATTINLYYVRSRYYVSVSLGTGVSSVSGGNAYYYYGQAVSLYGTPSTYYRFYYFYKDGGYTYNRSLSFTMGTANVSVTAYGTACTTQYSCSVGNVSGSQCYYSASGSQTCACTTGGGSTKISSTGYYYSLGYPECGYHACTSSCTCDTSGASFLGVAYKSNGNPYYQSWSVKYYGWSRSYQGNDNWYQWRFQSGSTSYVDPNYCYGTVNWGTCYSNYSCPYGGYVSGSTCYMNANPYTPTSC